MRGLFTIVVLLTWSAALAWETPRSGYEYLPKSIQQMQDDMNANPGMFVVDEGRALFHSRAYNGKSCASCHGEDGSGLSKSALARYPVFDAKRMVPLTLLQRINDCRDKRQDEFPLPYDDAELVKLETYVRFLARGEKVNVDISGGMRPYYEAGRQLYNSRIGQLELACTHCHDRYVDQRLRDQVLNQGHSNAFPAHRMLSGDISSLHEKFRDCYATLRALPYAPGSEEFINLEVYLNARGNGLRIETPGIRR